MQLEVLYAEQLLKIFIVIAALETDSYVSELD
jgi:hypothetical protein